MYPSTPETRTTSITLLLKKKTFARANAKFERTRFTNRGNIFVKLDLVRVENFVVYFRELTRNETIARGI